jgi:hypothetical protein
LNHNRLTFRVNYAREHIAVVSIGNNLVVAVKFGAVPVVGTSAIFARFRRIKSSRERVGPTIDNLHLVQSSYRIFRQFLSDFQHFSRRARFHPTYCLAYPGCIAHLQVLGNPAPRHIRSGAASTSIPASASPDYG